MTDEEKEATEWLKRLVKINKRDNLDNTFAEILLNLIKKQSKEIEELKDMNERQQYRIELVSEDEIEELREGFKIQEHNYQVAMKEIEYKWEDKIKAKIEEIDRKIEFEQNEKVIIYLHKQKRVLQSLLEKE